MNPIYTRTVVAHFDWLEAKIDQGAMFFVCHSGGKDSQALAAVVESLVPADQIVYVHADLGNVEWPGIKDHIRAGLPAGRTLEVVQAIYADGTPKGLLDKITRNHERLVAKGKNTNPWPDQGARFCTGELKTDPIWKLIRNWPVEAEWCRPAYPDRDGWKFNCLLPGSPGQGRKIEDLQSTMRKVGRRFRGAEFKTPPAWQ